jgi:hypothetical protein
MGGGGTIFASAAGVAVTTNWGYNMRELTINEVVEVAGGKSKFWETVGKIADSIAIATAAAWAADQVPTSPATDYDGNTSGSGQSTNPNAFGA